MHPVVRGEEEQPGKSNYFIGNDPKKWRTNIANFGRVRVEGVYPGVDVVYYGSQGGGGEHLEHDFIVAPGANPSMIRLGFSGLAGARGATKLRINRAGDFLAAVPGGSVTLERPVVYQELTGQRKRVAGRYVMLGHDQVGFAVGR